MKAKKQMELAIKTGALLSSCKDVINGINALQIIFDKQVDVELIYSCTNYDHYLDEMNDCFKRVVEPNGADKQEWFDTYVLEEEEWDLLRSLA